MADIVGYCGLELAMVWAVPPAESLAALRRWKSDIDSRASADVARYSKPSKAPH